MLYARVQAGSADAKRPILVGLFNAQADDELIRIAEQERDGKAREEVLAKLRLLGTPKALRVPRLYPQITAPRRTESVYDSRSPPGPRESQISRAGRRIPRGRDWPILRSRKILFMADCPDHSAPPGRRRALVVFVNATLAIIAGGFSALLGAFALRPPNGGTAGRWVRAGTTAELKAGGTSREDSLGRACERLVSRARARNSVSGLGRARTAFAPCQPRAPTLAARSSGTARARSSSARATAASTAMTAASCPVRRRGLSTSSRRRSIPTTRRCWCGCEADARALGLPTGSTRAPGSAPRPA